MMSTADDDDASSSTTTSTENDDDKDSADTASAEEDTDSDQEPNEAVADHDDAMEEVDDADAMDVVVDDKGGGNNDVYDDNADDDQIIELAAAEAAAATASAASPLKKKQPNLPTAAAAAATSSASSEKHPLVTALKAGATAPSFTKAGPTNNKQLHPKMRIKLSLKLPTQANAKKKLPTSGKDTADGAVVVGDNNEVGEEEDEVSAMVVDSDEVVDVVAVPSSPVSSTDEPTEQPTKSKAATKLFKKPLPVTKAATGTASKRKPLVPSKQVRFPPIGSPGLLMARPPPGSGQGPKQAAMAAAIAAAVEKSGNSKGLFTSQQIFEATMANAGYTSHQRSTRPHRGSSVQRTVGDLFDTDVKLAFKPVELVPKELLSEEKDGVPLPHLLIQRLRKRKYTGTEGNESRSNCSHSKRKRYNPCPFRHMAPVSLTIPYPDEYIRNRIDYIKDVKNREKAITKWQAAQEQIEMMKEERERREMQVGSTDLNGDKPTKFRNPVTIPPIPEPPEPPRLQDLLSPEDEADFSDEPTVLSPYHYLDPKGTDTAEHPIYRPKGKEDMVGHLDKNCFHIADGRYFGLLSNRIVDPNFVGANAPGIGGTGATGAGGGLATATTATTTSTSGLSGGGMAMILSASFHCAAAIPATKEAPPKEKTPTGSKKKGGKAATDKKDASVSRVETKKDSTPSVDDGQTEASEATTKSSTTIDVKNLVSAKKKEGKALTLKDSILRAAVLAARTRDLDHDTFRGPNGELFAGLGKAFSTSSGMKPCEGCKNNKQGVYHCRIRRRHMDPDYDGGSSINMLKPFFELPMESLKQDSVVAAGGGTSRDKELTSDGVGPENVGTDDLIIETQEDVAGSRQQNEVAAATTTKQHEEMS